MDTYFNASVDRAQTCEIFLIDGIPAAAMLYTETLCDAPIVDAFIYNKGLLLMFDAGPHMRSSLYERYKGVDIKNAIGGEEFLLL